MYPALQVNSLPLNYLEIPVSSNSLFIGSFNETSGYFCLNNHYWLTTKSGRCHRNRIIYYQRSSQADINSSPLFTKRKQACSDVILFFFESLIQFPGFWQVPESFAHCSSSSLNWCVCCRFSCIQLFAIPWTVTCQILLSMRFSRQEYWSGLPCPPPGDHPNPQIEPASLKPPALTGGFFTTSTTCWNSLNWYPILFNLLEITFGIEKSVPI